MIKKEVFWKNLGYKGFGFLKKDIACDYLIVGGGGNWCFSSLFSSKKKQK